MKSHQTLQVFYVLDIFRDKKGRELDARPNNLLSNNALSILARNKPINAAEMKKCFDPLPNFIQKYETQI